MAIDNEQLKDMKETMVENFKELYKKFDSLIALLNQTQIELAVLKSQFKEHKADEASIGIAMDERIRALENNPLVRIGFTIGAFSLVGGVILLILKLAGVFE